MRYALFGALILALSAPSSAAAQPNLAAATLPNARSVQEGQPVTFFATVLNSGDTDATNCRVIGDPSNSLGTDMDWRSTDAGNNPVGDTNDPFTVPAGGSQTLVLTMRPVGTSAGSAWNAEFACDEASVSGALGTSIVYVRSIPTGTTAADIIMVLQTLSNDGVIRIAENGRRGVAAGAAVNIGAEAYNGVFQVGYPGQYYISFGPAETHYRDILICLTDSNGVCLNPPTETIEFGAAFGSTNRWPPDEVKTFNIYFDDAVESDVPFIPEFLRLGALFYEYRVQGQGRSGIAGATSAAVSQPDRPDLPADEPLSGVWYGYYGDAEDSTFGRIQVTLSPEGDFVMRANLGHLRNNFDIPQPQLLVYGQPTVARIGDALHLSGPVSTVSTDGTVETSSIDGLVLNLRSRMTGRPTVLGGERARGYFYRQLPAEVMSPARSVPPEELTRNRWSFNRLSAAGFESSGTLELSEDRQSFTGSLTASAGDGVDTCQSVLTVTAREPDEGDRASQTFDAAMELNCSGNAGLALSGTYSGWAIADSWLDLSGSVYESPYFQCGILVMLEDEDGRAFPMYGHNDLYLQYGAPPCNDVY